MTDRTLDALPPRSVAIVQGFGKPLNRSILIGGIVTVVAVIALEAIGAGERLGLVFAPIVIAAIAGLVGLLVAILVLPTRIRRAFEAYSWLGHAEVQRFRQRTGAPVPNKVDAMEQWLAAAAARVGRHGRAAGGCGGPAAWIGGATVQRRDARNRRGADPARGQ